MLILIDKSAAAARFPISKVKVFSEGDMRNNLGIWVDTGIDFIVYFSLLRLILKMKQPKRVLGSGQFFPPFQAYLDSQVTFFVSETGFTFEKVEKLVQTSHYYTYMSLWPIAWREIFTMLCQFFH